MKRALMSVMALIVGIALLGCESDKVTNYRGGSTSQIMYVYADRCHFWDEQNDRVIDAAIAGGVVIGDPLPRFDYIEVNDSMFAGGEYCTYQAGYCTFGSFG
jgi:hypothetical protein